MTLNHRNIFINIKNLVKENNLDYSFASLWNYFSKDNTPVFYKDIAAIENWYNNLKRKEVFVQKTINNQKQILKTNQKLLHLQWNFSVAECHKFFSIIIDEQRKNDIHLNNVVILLFNFTGLCALVYNNKLFNIYISAKNKSYTVQKIEELVAIISTTLAKEFESGQYMLPLTIEIFPVGATDYSLEQPKPYSIDIGKIYREFFIKRIEQLHEANAKAINQASIAGFKRWAYYAELTTNPYIHDLLIEANLPKYGLNYYNVNYNDDYYKQNYAHTLLLNSLLDHKLIFNVLTLATPLELSIFNNDLSLLKKEIKKNMTQLNLISNYYNATPLMQAAYLGKNKALKQLLKHTLNINQQNHKGLTALSFAILGNNIKGCILLLKTGANPNLGHYYFPPLAITIELKQLIICRLLLKHIVDLECIDLRDYTGLYLAVKQKNFIFCQLLLENGADPNCKATNTLPPLHVAMLEWCDEYKKISHLLLKHGADPNCVDEQGNTPLQIAAKRGNDSACKLLITYGADINQTNNAGNTAIQEAILAGHDSPFFVLLKTKANLNIKNNNGETALHIAIKKISKRLFFTHTRIGMIKHLLLYGADPNIELQNESILFQTIGNLAIYNLLIKHGAKQDCRNFTGETILHLAAKEGYTEICRSYLEQGLSINLTNKKGKTALHYAVTAKKLGLCEILLAYGANIEAADNEGLTPLHMATKLGSLRIAGLLLKQKAKVDSIDNKDLTSLHYAASLGYYEGCKLLLTYNANINYCNKDKISPLLLAYYYGYLDICELFINNGAIMFTPEQINNLTLYSEITIIPYKEQNLLARQCTIINHGSFGRDFFINYKYSATTLSKKAESNNFSLKLLFYCSIIVGRADLCILLLTNGFDANCKLSEDLQAHISPLYLAIIYGRTEICGLLLKHGAKINLNNEITSSPLYTAMYYNRTKIVDLLKDFINTDYLFTAIENKDEEICAILLNYDVEINKMDHIGRTPLRLAIVEHQEKICRLLLENGADPNLTNENYIWYYPVAMAAQFRQITIFKLLITHGAYLHKLDKFGNSFLRAAIQDRDKIFCELLLRSGIDPNDRVKDCPFLSTAIGNDSEFNDDDIDFFYDVLFDDSESDDVDCSIPFSVDNELFALPLKEKNDVKQFFNIANSMLAKWQHAYNNYEICELLLRYKAKPNFDHSYITPIWKSINIDSFPIFNLFLKYGSKILATDAYELKTAIKNNNIAICKLLLEEGQKQKNINHSLDYFWIYTLKANNSSICSLLIKHGANVNAKIYLELVVAADIDIKSQQKIFAKLCGKNAILLTNQNKVYFIINKKFVLHVDGKPKWISIENRHGFSFANNELIIAYNIHDNVAGHVILQEVIEKASLSSLLEKTDILILALKHKIYGVINALLKNRANLNSKDECGRTPLHLAVIQSMCSIGKKLITLGADVNALDHEGYTPLGLAVLYGREEFCIILLNAGVDLNLSGTNTCPPLHVACIYGYKEIIKLLIKHKAHLITKDKETYNFPYKDGLPEKQEVYTKIFAKILNQKQTILDENNWLAGDCDNEETYNILVAWEKESTKLNNRLTALHIAASCGLINVCKRLLSSKVDCNIIADKFGMPLTIAIKHGYLNICKLLLTHKINVNLNLEPLWFLAINNYRLKIGKYLIKLHTNIDATNKFGMTALAQASSRGDEELCKFLIKLGADVNFNLMDITPLHLAVKNDHISICKLLLKYGANINITDHNNKTSMDLAIDKGNEAIYKLLLNTKIS